MNISPLQKARYEYTPKLPGMLRNGIADICVCEGAETQSVADQDKIKALFPNTYGKKEITFQKGSLKLCSLGVGLLELGISLGSSLGGGSLSRSELLGELSVVAGELLHRSLESLGVASCAARTYGFLFVRHRDYPLFMFDNIVTWKYSIVA